MLTTNATCTIPVRSKSAPARLRELGARFHADAIDPLEYKCLRCGLEWDDSPLRNYREVVCSNCYGERVILTMVRLGFEDWGPRNGGAQEQERRYSSAQRSFSTALKAIRGIKA